MSGALWQIRNTLMNLSSGMKITLLTLSTGMLKDNVIGEQIIADYLLYMMNRSGNFEYVLQG